MSEMHGKRRFSETELPETEEKRVPYYNGTAYDPAAEVEGEAEDEPEEALWEREKKKEEKRWFTAIQIAACALILLGVLVLKALGGPVYETVREWYVTHINDSIIAQEKWSGVLKLPQNDAEAQPSSQTGSSAEKPPKGSEDSSADVSGTETKPEGPGESGDG